MIIPGRIPIAIHPVFWFFAALIGWMNSQNFLGIVIWVFVIFVSVVVHEYGHALTAVLFGQSAKIQLIALGGVTTYDGGPKLTFWQQFLIVLNGPIFGFLLFVIATIFLQKDWSEYPLLFFTLKIFQVANLFWTVVNLLPIMPLDGGQLLRIVMEALFGMKGFRATLLIGALLSTTAAFAFFAMQSFLVGAIFFLFAFQSFVSWKRSEFATKGDREGGVREKLIEAEVLFLQGNKQKAKEIFEEIVSKKDLGLLGTTAAEYLAFIYAEEGKNQEAYDLLLPFKDHLEEAAKPLLFKLAFRFKNDSLVAEFSKECYQISETQEIALMSARSFARLKRGKPAGGWLLTAWQHGGLDLQKILSEEEFAALKEDAEFLEFVKQMI